MFVPCDWKISGIGSLLNGLYQPSQDQNIFDFEPFQYHLSDEKTVVLMLLGILSNIDLQGGKCQEMSFAHPLLG